MREFLNKIFVLKTFKTNIIISLIVLFFNSSFYKPATKKNVVNSSDNLEFTVLNKKTLKLAENFIFLKKDFNGFKEKLAFRESGGRYHCINKFGYIGKYQFNLSTLKMFKIYNGKKFLNNPELQEKVFLMNMQRNKWILRKDINWFVGSVINGLEITESGILAAAHLAGQGNVRKFLRNGFVFEDGNGTKMTSYMKQFGGYILNL